MNGAGETILVFFAAHDPRALPTVARSANATWGGVPQWRAVRAAVNATGIGAAPTKRGARAAPAALEFLAAAALSSDASTLCHPLPVLLLQLPMCADAVDHMNGSTALPAFPLALSARTLPLEALCSELRTEILDVCAIEVIGDSAAGGGNTLAIVCAAGAVLLVDALTGSVREAFRAPLADSTRLVTAAFLDACTLLVGASDGRVFVFCV